MRFAKIQGELDCSMMGPKAEELLKRRAGILGCEPHLREEGLDYITTTGE